MLLDIDSLPWRSALTDAHRAGFAYLDVLTVVDRTDLSGDQVGPWEFLAHVLRPADGERLWVREVRNDPRIESVSDLFPAAAWHEREIAEMFGIEVSSADPSVDPGTHATVMRPLLLPPRDGSPAPSAYPLRKGVALLARITTRWPGAHDPTQSDQAPGEDDAGSRRSRTRRALRPPGVPEAWLTGHPSAGTGAAESTHEEGDHG